MLYLRSVARTFLPCEQSYYYAATWLTETITREITDRARSMTTRKYFGDVGYSENWRCNRRRTRCFFDFPRPVILVGEEKSKTLWNETGETWYIFCCNKGKGKEKRSGRRIASRRKIISSQDRRCRISLGLASIVRSLKRRSTSFHQHYQSSYYRCALRELISWQLRP